MTQVTQILQAIDAGDTQAAEELLPLVYDELRRLAAQKLSGEKPGQTLQATALVHEAYIRLIGPTDQGWNSRGHFFGAAAEAMRRILIERARRKQSQKGGGNFDRLELSDGVALDDSPAIDLLALDEALRQFEKDEPLKAELVKLRFFAGLSVDQAAESLDISRATAKRYWVYARAWLYGQISPD
jgi:RNA polymerase sigma factor (TIGR02999 family)